ncbi:hypothetical protein [Paraliobacillus sp. JSM ZJ581]|uniref:hypothetical protein n=1 Tax=Paraliobacillus sp. JSM ZJ581 TaxID=3342118 RepID=UPI0035A8C7D0
MERIMKRNNDEITMKYIVVSLFSLLTLQKVNRVEKFKKELKEQLEHDGDFDKL